MQCGHISLGLQKTYQTVTHLVAFPDYQELGNDQLTGKVVDEQGRDYKRVNACYLGTVEEKSRPYIAEATVVAHPNTQEITLVIDQLIPMDSVIAAQEPVELSYDQLEELIAKLERYTAVKGRRDAHFWTLQGYSSPHSFRFDGEKVEHLGHATFCWTSFST